MTDHYFTSIGKEERKPLKSHLPLLKIKIKSLGHHPRRDYVFYFLIRLDI